MGSKWMWFDSEKINYNLFFFAFERSISFSLFSQRIFERFEHDVMKFVVSWPHNS